MTLASQFRSVNFPQEDSHNQSCREQTSPNGAHLGKDGVVDGAGHPVTFPSTERRRRISAENRDGEEAVETEPLRLLISDRTALGCELMLLGLRRRRDLIGSVMCATSSTEVERVARTQQPEVALVSAALSDGPLAGFRVLPALQTFLPKCAVIVLLDDNNEELAIDAFRARARGVFHRADPMEQLVKCIERVRQGEIWAGQKEIRAVFDAFADSTPFSGSTSSTFDLNGRELMIARLVAKGQTNRQIGRRLNLSEHTIKNYLYRVFEKVGIRSRVELAVLMMNEPLQNGNGTAG
jgi:two-component system, NarL family, nitrate/nitrite response regulator NarL